MELKLPKDRAQEIGFTALSKFGIGPHTWNYSLQVTLISARSIRTSDRLSIASDHSGAIDVCNAHTNAPTTYFVADVRS